MANHQEGPVTITIPEVLTEDGVTLYLVVVEVGSLIYRVRHRYSHFEAMHSKLVEDGIDKESLPPKKLIGNKDPAFIMKRRKELETYLQTVYRFFAKSLPQTLAEFLDFPTYDIHYVLQGLACDFHEKDLRTGSGSDSGLLWSPLHLYAVSERLKTPCPPLNTDDKKYDFTNVVDVCCNTTSLTVTGSIEPLGTSQLIPNKLPIDFLAFKSLSRLDLRGLEVRPETVTSLGILRSTLQTLRATECGIACVAEILLCDVTCTEDDLAELIENPGHSWPRLLQLDLRYLSQSSLKWFLCL